MKKPKSCMDILMTLLSVCTCIAVLMAITMAGVMWWDMIRTIITGWY